MWHLNEPDYHKCFNNDVNSLVDHCAHLVDTDKPRLTVLYRQYRMNNGFATSAQLAPLSPKKDTIEKQYTSKMTGTKTLGYVRVELMDGVTLCPFCGINEPTQLDHYMDMSTYGQLACCRLNLVPSCGLCNQTKGKQSYTDFVHTYYDQFPDVDFLITRVTVKNNHVGFVFSIDKSVLPHANNLDYKVESQFVKLKLDERLHRAGISFVNSLLKGFKSTTDKSLKTELKQQYEYYCSLYFRNDWRTSIIRGLIQSPSFSIKVLDGIRNTKYIKPVNGAGA